MRFQYHHETRVTLNTGIDTAFAYLDRFEALSAHMEKRSPMMMGSRMHIDTDERGGRAVGSKVRMSGRVLGVALSLEEVVTERDPPRFKAWETREVRLLAIGHLCALVHPPHRARRYEAPVDLGPRAPERR